jgi:hypothetical protein
MNLSDYLIIAVIGQVFWLIRKVSKQNATIEILKSQCPLLNSPKVKKEGGDGRPN